MNFQDTLQTIRQKAFPRTYALECELSDLRDAHAHVVTEMDGVRDELTQTREQDTQQLAELQQQLELIDAERKVANEQVHSLEASLMEAADRQQGAEQHILLLETKRKAINEQVHSLETSLAEAAVLQQGAELQIQALEKKRKAANEQVQSLERSLTEAAERQKDTEQHVQSLETKYKTANEQVQSLEQSLTEAADRQLGTEQHIQLLETKMDEMRAQYEASIGLTQETLLHLQTEQKNLFTSQTDQVNAFHVAGRQLLESVQTCIPKPGISMVQVAMLSGLLFLSGALVSGLIMRSNDSRSVDMAIIEGGIVDLQQLTKAHFDSHDELLKILAKALDRETALLEKPDKPAVSQTPVVPDQPQVTLADEIAQTKVAVTGTDEAPLTDTQIADLQVLGFRTEQAGNQALTDFRALYLPAIKGQPQPSPEAVRSVLIYYSVLARSDAEKYQLDEQVVAAIRLGSIHTGVEYSFLMELADVESGFNPAARSPTSNAVGLYQFRDETWLDAVHNYGSTYGLGNYVREIKHVLDDAGRIRASISDEAMRESVLALRLDPRLSSLLAAEHVRKNRMQLSSTLERQPGRTELYLTHFFGPTGAVSFLKALEEDPGQIAGEIFPGPAKRNRYVFQDKARKPRTVADIYKLFDRKFYTSRYEEQEPG